VRRSVAPARAEALLSLVQQTIQIFDRQTLAMSPARNLED
jgi:hypothetical protein